MQFVVHIVKHVSDIYYTSRFEAFNAYALFFELRAEFLPNTADHWSVTTEIRWLNEWPID